MPRKKISFNTKSFTIRITDELLEVIDGYVESLEKEKGVEVTRNVVANEALREYLATRNLLQSVSS